MAGDGFSRRTFLYATVAAGTATAVGIGGRAAEAAASGFCNPFGGYPITGTWQEHLNRGSLGGIDYGMPVGTQLPAAGGGVVTNDPNNGTGGYTVTPGSALVALTPDEFSQADQGAGEWRIPAGCKLGLSRQGPFQGEI